MSTVAQLYFFSQKYVKLVKCDRTVELNKM